MAADEPPYLTIGTDVSAKYKGAFCEAKIKKVNRVVKCKVTFKNNLGTFMVTDDQIKGSLRIGADIDAKHPEKNQFVEGVINKLQDYSQYTVVFDDGDETTLRRTSLCLKSGRHFAESPTLDQFPLTNPEHFGTPVIGTSKLKRKRRSTMNSSLDYESSEDESVPRKVKAIRGKEQNPDLGKVVCVDYGDRRKKENWYPGLIVPHPAQSTIKISKEEHLIRSFKDGKYYQVPKRDIREFSKEAIQKVENNALRLALEKATNYLEKDELPPHWDKALFACLESQSADEDSRESDYDTSDNEPGEEQDRFVAQLYKFMEERGTPINKAPTVSNRDLNMYKLFKMTHKHGGYNKVTNLNKWKVVYAKMGLPPSVVSGPNQIKSAYKRYLQSFEEFYRKLGCTMVSNSRSTRAGHRSDRNVIITRTRDLEATSPKGRNSKEAKDKVYGEEKAKVPERKQEETAKADNKLRSPEKKKVDKTPRMEEKEEKKKRDEKPRLIRSQSLTKEKKDQKPEKARTREDARKEKNESPEKKGTRSSSKMELLKKEESLKDKKEKSPKEKEKEKKEEKVMPKEIKEVKVIKKEEKVVKERKLLRDKKVEEKSVKEKRENPAREKREEKPVKEKRDLSKEPVKEEKLTPSKPKKEDVKSSEEKPSPKRKLERISKEKVEEKAPKSRCEEKPESGKKVAEEVEVKEVKPEPEVKKEEAKEKLRPKLRERKEDAVGEESVAECLVEIEEAFYFDGMEKKPLMPKLKGEDSEEPPSKVKRKSLKSEDREESLLGLSDSDESCTNDSEKGKDVKHNEIEIGDRVKVKYGRGRLQKVYEAKVLKIEMDGPDKRFYVHYAGWNTRYDEWVRKNYIVANISNAKQKTDSKPSTSLVTGPKKVDRGRPPGMPMNAKLDRKNSTSSTSSRATRSEKKSSLSLSGGLEPKKRMRRKSGTSATDVSQESDTDGLIDMEDEEAPTMPPSFKEELFSDDEEKEKLEDVKRGDITELEKAISVEDDIKGLCFSLSVERTPILEEKKPKEEENSDLVEKIQEASIPETESRIHADTGSSVPKPPSDSKPDEDPVVNTTPVGSEKSPVVTFPLISLPELKPEKVSEFSLASSYSVSTPKADKFFPTPPPVETKCALSFTGLIKKSASEDIPKAALISKIPPPEKPVERSSLEGKVRAVSIFGSVFSTRKPESASAEKLPTKDGRDLFSRLGEPEKIKDYERKTEVNPPSSETPPPHLGGIPTQAMSVHVTPKPEVDLPPMTEEHSCPKADAPIPILSVSSKSSEEGKESMEEPSKLSEAESKDSESKPKDTFDILMHGSSSFCSKLIDTKDSLFSFSFGSQELASESPQSESKLPTPSTESLCRMSSKLSDTLDVSKMIPGILERLKKDVVADMKVSDSPPPPPKEELNFDFLRGSQSNSKSLSRSDSSNSLRICESDTNDSNTESKDLIADDKLTMPPIMPSICDVLEEKSVDKSLPKSFQEPSDSLKSASDSSAVDAETPDSATALITSQPASVITTVAAPIDIQPPPLEEIEPLQNAPKEESLPELATVGTDNSDVLKCDLPLFSENPPPATVEKDDVKVSDCDGHREEDSSAGKLSLFDELKSSSNHGQNSVIKCITEVAEPLAAEAATLEKDEAEDENGVPKEDSCTELKKEPNFEVQPGSEEGDLFSQLSKKEVKRKKLAKKMGKKFGSSETLEKEDSKTKDGRLKSKKRIKFESGESDKNRNLDLKGKTKKLKKNKNKKRFSRHEDQFGEHIKKFEFREDDHRDSVLDKIKKKDKKRSEKKFLKSNMKGEDFPDSKSDLSKKKKSKKNRDKLAGEKKDFFEKKTKKKRKSHLEENQDTDSEKESVPKIIDKKRKKERKKIKVKDCSSSDDAAEKYFKEKNKDLSSSLLRQDSKSDDPDMSFLLCEEKVPASPGDAGDDTSGSSSAEESERTSAKMEMLPSVYPCCSGSNRAIDHVLDNTPPTTPSSTESLLSSSPSHERDSFSINYPESTQSGEGESDLFHCNSNRTVARGSEEYRAATTLAFAVCKTVAEKPKDGGPQEFGKRQKGEHSPSKRKKKRVQRYTETSKSPKHKSSFPRMPKVESYCEDSSGTSPATSSSPPYANLSTLSFTRSIPHRLSEGSSRYSFYVPLHEKDPEKRISVLQDKMAALRKRYMALRAEVIAIDHKRRRARKKVKENAGVTMNPSLQSEDGQSCS